MKKIILFFLFGVVPLALSACGDKDSKKDDGPAKATIYVRGNPNKVIQGATLNRVSPITVANYERFNHFHLFSIFEFPEKDEVVQSTNLIAENAPSEEPSAPSGDVVDKLAVKIGHDDGVWTMSLLGGAAIIVLQPDAQGRLQPVAFTDTKGTESLPLQVLHWSTHKDGNAVSLLLKSEDSKKGTELLALYFEKNGDPVEPKLGDRNHQYIAGPGVDIGWTLNKGEDLQVHLCGANSMPDAPEQSVAKWNRVLAGRLHMNLTTPAMYAPFSDLNEHCIQVVDAYMMDGRPNVAEYGVTLSILSSLRSRIVDSDIFLFQAEFDKVAKINGQFFADRNREKKAPLALVHELGHFLGLDHKFDGTKSVMSYSYDSYSPTAYDVAAVQELYPLAGN